jgi:hypothetical protein
MRRKLQLALASGAGLALAGCVTAAPTESGFLSSYAALEVAEQAGTARLRQFQDAATLAGVTRISIAPTIALPEVVAEMGEDALSPLLMEIDAELCRELSERFEITTDPAALRVRAGVTAVARTGAASSVFSAAASRAIPGPVTVRLPIGLGGLSAELEARHPKTGALAAQLSWSRRAQVLMDGGSLSEIGDAHQMAEPFADAALRVMTLAGVEPAATLNPETCPGVNSGAAGRFVAARVTGLHFVPGAPTDEAAPAEPAPAHVPKTTGP